MIFNDTTPAPCDLNSAESADIVATLNALRSGNAIDQIDPEGIRRLATALQSKITKITSLHLKLEALLVALPPPEAPIETKDWHVDVDAHYRNNMTERIALVMYPFPDETELENAKALQRISNARKIEHELFTKAGNMNDYCQMVHVCVYNTLQMKTQQLL